MKISNEKTTVYLDPRVKKSVKYYAVRDERSLSDIINEKLFEYLEDMADLAALKEAKKDGEEFIPFEQVLSELGLDLDEIQTTAQAERKKTTKKA